MAGRRVWRYGSLYYVLRRRDRVRLLELKYGGNREIRLWVDDWWGRK